jgi:hypothetical protein
VSAGHSSAGSESTARVGHRKVRCGHRPAPRARASESGDTRGVGFNPYRPQRRRQSDYAFVGAAFVVMIVLLVWAFL